MISEYKLVEVNDIINNHFAFTYAPAAAPLLPPFHLPLFLVFLLLIFLLLFQSFFICIHYFFFPSFYCFSHYRLLNPYLCTVYYFSFSSSSILSFVFFSVTLPVPLCPLSVLLLIVLLLILLFHSCPTCYPFWHPSRCLVLCSLSSLLLILHLTLLSISCLLNNVQVVHFFFLWRFDPIPDHGFPLRGFAIAFMVHATLGRTPMEE